MTKRIFVLCLLMAFFFCLFCMGCITTDPQPGFMIEQPTEGGQPDMYFYLDIPFSFNDSGGP